jgi:hypothetical protein
LNVSVFAKALLNTGTSLCLVFGTAYLVDCRWNTRGPWDAQDRCWLTAGSMMGIGGMGKAGYMLGYNTYNPSLRDPSRTEQTDAPLQ